MSLSTPLPVAAQSAYAELLEVVRQDELGRSVGNLSGSFNRKVVKGVTYWYYQFTDSAGLATRQMFVGRDSAELRKLVEQARTRDTSRVEALARAAMTLGSAAATPVHFRIIRRLNEIGFFGAGGVLVGAHSFLAYGNALGVAWGDISRTQDIDFAHAGRNISLALPANLRVGARDALSSLESGFLPVSGFHPTDKTATFVSKVDKQLRVDFLTPLVGGKSNVYEHDALGVTLQPLPFLEFILEDIYQAVVLSSVGAVLVNVPDAGRFALHKLIVFAERQARSPEKARKDLRQAAALIEVLWEFRAEDLLQLWGDLVARGAGWRARARKAIVALGKLAPDLEAVAPMNAAIPAATPTKKKAR